MKGLRKLRIPLLPAWHNRGMHERLMRLARVCENVADVLESPDEDTSMDELARLLRAAVERETTQEVIA